MFPAKSAIPSSGRHPMPSPRLTEEAYFKLFGPAGTVSPREVAYIGWQDPGKMLAQLEMLYESFCYRPRVRGSGRSYGRGSRLRQLSIYKGSLRSIGSGSGRCNRDNRRAGKVHRRAFWPARSRPPAEING